MSKDDFIKEMREVQEICDKAMKGENVRCPKCGTLLIVNRFDSGKPPSVSCPNNDFNVLINLNNK
ncbi:hypothetical protein D3C76_1330670 [compost metagenome]